MEEACSTAWGKARLCRVTRRCHDATLTNPPAAVDADVESGTLDARRWGQGGQPLTQVSHSQARHCQVPDTRTPGGHLDLVHSPYDGVPQQKCVTVWGHSVLLHKVAWRGAPVSHCPGV